MIGSYQGFMMMLSNFLRIPPGVQVRKSYGVSKEASTDWYGKTLASHDFINTIVDITADDVCIGNSPVYMENMDTAFRSPKLKLRYKDLLKAVNRIVKWTAVDLLKSGISAYELKIATIEIPVLKDGVKGKDKREIPNLVPITDEIEVFMTEDGQLAYFVDGQLKEDILIFLNYSKEQISKNEEDFNRDDPRASYKYKITPQPVQLKHVQTVAQDLFMVERSMYRYRVQLSKIVRFAETEVGLSQGNDNNDIVVDNASAAVNANSMSLGMSSAEPTMNFDDNLPIVPVRKGVGSIEIKSDIPDFSAIKEMPDLEYTLNRLFLALRFPKSYADFNTAMSDTAVSLIRGDIRYSRMVDFCRSIIQDTLNVWVFGVNYDPIDSEASIKMTTLPNSEDDDVVEALSKYSDFTSEVYEFINVSESKAEALSKINSISILLGDSANIKSIQKWIVAMKEYVEEKFAEEEESVEELPDEESVEELPDEESSEVDEAFDIESDEDNSDEGNSPELAQEPPEAFDLPPINE